MSPQNWAERFAAAYGPAMRFIAVTLLVVCGCSPAYVAPSAHADQREPSLTPASIRSDHARRADGEAFARLGPPALASGNGTRRVDFTRREMKP